MNVISKPGLMNLLEGKSKDVRDEAIKWYRAAAGGDWGSFAAVREAFPDADLVAKLLVFNLRGNRFRLIVYPVFSRRKFYIKALLSHKEYDRKDWVNKWP